MVLLAAFQALLGRYSGQDDVAVGTPVANRTRPELEGLIGFFVNTLVLRADLARRALHASCWRAAREATLEASARQDVPFEQLVEELQPERDPSRTPLFQVMLALQNAPLGALELPGLRLQPGTPTAAPPSSISRSPWATGRTATGAALSSTARTSSTAPPPTASAATSYGCWPGPWRRPRRIGRNCR